MKHIITAALLLIIFCASGYVVYADIPVFGIVEPTEGNATLYAENNLDYAFHLVRNNEVQCEREIKRESAIRSGSGLTPESDSYLVAEVIFKMPQGASQCLAFYEIYAFNLFAMRPLYNAHCEIDYSRATCWKSMVTQTDRMLVYGRLPDDLLYFRPTLCVDEELRWTFNYHAVHIPYVATGE